MKLKKKANKKFGDSCKGSGWAFSPFVLDSCTSWEGCANKRNIGRTRPGALPQVRCGEADGSSGPTHTPPGHPPGCPQCCAPGRGGTPGGTRCSGSPGRSVPGRTGPGAECGGGGSLGVVCCQLDQRLSPTPPEPCEVIHHPRSVADRPVSSWEGDYLSKDL